VLPLTISEFAQQHADEKFDMVTFFEVLEHQAAPLEFLQKVKTCLRPRGTIALSVPNRERWKTGPDVLDYPPNHFLRWNAAALRSFLSAQGFEVLSMREEQAGVAYTTQMIHTASRTGITQRLTAETQASFRDVIQMTPEQAEAVLHAKRTTGQLLMETLGRIKYVTCFPLAVAAFPYVRLRRYKGAYLYCLARRCD
jgi:SAM-dependent methyltransferase